MRLYLIFILFCLACSGCSDKPFFLPKKKEYDCKNISRLYKKLFENKRGYYNLTPIDLRMIEANVEKSFKYHNKREYRNCIGKLYAITKFIKYKSDKYESINIDSLFRKFGPYDPVLLPMYVQPLLPSSERVLDTCKVSSNGVAPEEKINSIKYKNLDRVNFYIKNDTICSVEENSFLEKVENYNISSFDSLILEKVNFSFDVSSKMYNRKVKLEMNKFPEFNDIVSEARDYGSYVYIPKSEYRISVNSKNEFRDEEIKLQKYLGLQALYITSQYSFHESRMPLEIKFQKSRSKSPCLYVKIVYSE